MKRDVNSRRLLLLTEPRSADMVDIRSWLASRGYVAWQANDFSHAIEELSDFTVKNRPDVVMLEVSPLFECFDTLRESLCPADGESDLSVVAMCDAGANRLGDRNVARNLDQLQTIISRESRSAVEPA